MHCRIFNTWLSRSEVTKRTDMDYGQGLYNGNTKQHALTMNKHAKCTTI